ncbi:MAG: hypothetical protein M0Z80_04670 [Treponema sp.]|nr:hypothetical protein [Treponema sp.]
MDGPSGDEGLSSLSRFELVSEYVEKYYSLEPPRRASLERELERRGIPLPSMPPDPPPGPAPPARGDRISIGCFLDYLLLFFIPAGALYAWIFLFERIVRRDSAREARHRLIQIFISLLYAIGEAFCAHLLLDE